MPERPLILFPRFENAEKKNLGGGSPIIFKPSFPRQVERLQPKLQRLQNAIDAHQIVLQHTPTALEPEYALVFETAGSPDSFFTAVRVLSATQPGLEWLFDVAVDEIPSSDDFHEMNKRGERLDRTISGKVYCIMSDQQALTEMLSLWRQYINNNAMIFPNGKTGFRDVFNNLIDIRPWGVQERLEETGILQAWHEEIAEGNQTPIPFEIELFYRKSPDKRQRNERDVTTAVQQLGGHIIGTSCCIDEISYHAMIAELPREQIQRIIAEREAIELVKVENIMFFRPTGQIIHSITNDSVDGDYVPELVGEINNEPIVALFDGLPQENHTLLQNFLIIDDPDDLTRNYAISQREHGTAMSSLIVHGDLLSRNRPIMRKIYVRPIMRPYQGLHNSYEEVSPEINLVDLIHRSVRRLFEPEEGGVPTAPTVKIINLSIGDPFRPFINAMSPLARLIDWLSIKYGVLFIISAGNHNLDGIKSPLEFEALRQLPIDERERHILNVINNNSRHQRILSPAESMNSLTIGSSFIDNAEAAVNPRMILPYQHKLPSPISALGRGYNNSVKPEIFFSGGRKLLIGNYGEIKNRWVNSRSNPPGCLAAAPYVPGGTTGTAYTHGTSDAAALISHEGAYCYEILKDVFTEQRHENIPEEYAALLLKGMLAHGASWDIDATRIIKEALHMNGRAADDLHKWLGYGIPDISRVAECTRNRITLIGYGSLNEGGAHIYQLPLPFDFSTRRIFRKLTATLAYFTPIVSSRQRYRAAQLWFSLEESGAKLFPDRQDADWLAARRSTLQHEIFYSERARPWGEDDNLEIRVNCREDAGPVTANIPYALFVTFEAAEGLSEDIYNSVVVKIRQRARVVPNI